MAATNDNWVCIALLLSLCLGKCYGNRVGRLGQYSTMDHKDAKEMVRLNHGKNISPSIHEVGDSSSSSYTRPAGNGGDEYEEDPPVGIGIGYHYVPPVRSGTGPGKGYGGINIPPLSIDITAITDIIGGAGDQLRGYSGCSYRGYDDDDVHVIVDELIQRTRDLTKKLDERCLMRS